MNEHSLGLHMGNSKSAVAQSRWMTHLFTGLVGLLTLGLGGCVVGPNYERPKTEMPAAWVPPTSAPSTQASITVAEPTNVGRWWNVFNDPTLNSLVDRAIASNLDLKQAETRIRQARASRKIVSTGLWPTLDSSAGYSRSGVRDVGSSLYQGGLDAAWELDIFGGTRRSVESADADVQATIEDRRDVLVTLTAEIALNYIDLRGFQREIAIARRNLALQTRTADLTRQRRAAGFVGSLDTANADATVATTESQIPALEQAEQQTIYTLSVLLGLPPAALMTELTPIAPIPTSPKVVPVGLPSDLLRRRPDIRRAEANLHAATANVGVATSDLFPKFSLTGSVGTRSNKLNGIFNWSNSVWSIGPSVSWPVFDAGRIRANIELQNAAAQQSLLGYQNTILIALQDVESALVAYDKEQARRDILADAVVANRQAVDISSDLYTNGNTDFLNVLNAQRSLLATEDALVQSDRTIATNLVALYKALGGGWETEQPTSQPASN